MIISGNRSSMKNASRTPSERKTIMRPARAAAYLVGGILLAGWLASAAGVGRPSMPQPPRRSPADAQLDFAAANVQAQASRLRQRLAAAPAPHPSIRNPFSFAPRVVAPSVAARPRPLVVAATDTESALPEPDRALVGLAEEGSTRTAMIASGNDLVMATEGQTIVGRYRVGKVGAGGIELIDINTGAVRRLSLKSPVLLP